MTKSIKLNINYESNKYKKVVHFNPSKLMNRLLEKKYQYIEILGGPIDKIADRIYLFVENDAEFLAEGYLVLRDHIEKKQNTFSHFCYLNDGILEIRAKINKCKVKVTYNYCNGLNILNLVSHTDEVTLDQYMWLWEKVVYGLLDVL